MNEKVLYDELVTFGKLNKEVKFTPAGLTGAIRRIVATDDISVSTLKSVTVDMNQVVIGGQYDPDEDEANFSSIRVFASYNPYQKEINLKDVRWKQLCITIVECVGHELVHQRQYRARGYDIRDKLFVSKCKEREKKEEQEYLGNPDEIEAYGYSVASELFLKYKMEEMTKDCVKKSQMFKVYASTFGINHPVVAELTEHIVNYYLQLSKGNTYDE